MSRPLFHVDVATTALPQDIAQPPGGIQTMGFPAHSKFAHEWANWLFNFNGNWNRELDQSCTRSVDFLSVAMPQRMANSGSGFTLPLNAGLTGLAATGGAVYVIFGRRVSITASELNAKYTTGFDLPVNTVVYAHLREETNFGGSSVGEVLISANANEAGYQRIWGGQTNATDLVSQVPMAAPAFYWVQPIHLAAQLEIDDPNDETALLVTGNGATDAVITATSNGGAPAFEAFPTTLNGVGYTCTLGVTAFTGFKSNMIAAPSGAIGFHVVGDAATTGPGIRVDYASTDVAAPAFVIAATGSGPAANISSTAVSTLLVTGGTGQSVSTFGSGSGAGLRSLSGLTSGANSINAVMGNTTGFGVYSQTSGSATNASRAVRAQAFNQGIAVDATAVSNDAVLATVSGSSGSSVHIIGRASDSTSTSGGRIDYNTTTNTYTLSDPTGAEQRDAWSSRGGCTVGFGSAGVVLSNNNNAVYTTAATLALTNANAPRRAGRTILLRFSFSVRSPGGLANILDVRIRDTTDNVTILANVGAGTASNAGYLIPAIKWDAGTGVPASTQEWGLPQFVEVSYTVPAAGDRTFVAEFKTNTANSIAMRNPLLVPFGLI